MEQRPCRADAAASSAAGEFGGGAWERRRKDVSVGRTTDLSSRHTCDVVRRSGRVRTWIDRRRVGTIQSGHVTRETKMNTPRGFTAAREYPLWDAIFGRRSRRVAAGSAFRSGSLSFSRSSSRSRSPGWRRRTDRGHGRDRPALLGQPLRNRGRQTLLGTPCVEGSGRAAGSPDNAQSTVFFMWEDAEPTC